MKTLLKITVVIPCVVALAMLAGCTPKTPSAGVSLPKAPSYYMACFNKLTDIPASDLTRSKVVELVAELRKSELRHSQCGKDLLAWYATVRSSFAGKKG